MDPLDLVDVWGPEKVVCVRDSRSGMQGVLVIDNTAAWHGQGWDADVAEHLYAGRRPPCAHDDLEVGNCGPALWWSQGGHTS